MAEVCQSPMWIWNTVEWSLSIVVTIFKEKGDIRKCS